MQKKHRNLITKHLSKETSKEEENLLFEKLNSNNKLKKEYDETEMLWNSFEKSKTAFDKDRILKILSFKIAQNKKQKRNKILYASYKYAAIVIGLITLSIFIIKDLTDTEIIVNHTGKLQKIKLPDNSIVSLNTDARIKYKNSGIIGFKREIEIEGEAFFEIAKSDEKQFTVHTPDFDISVLGTKFNVRTYEQSESIVLTEGKIRLNHFRDTDTTFTMAPGELLMFNKETQKFTSRKINTKIYTSWLSSKIEFDSFTLNELSELIKLRYNKELLINNSELAAMRISGSAPADDINMIIKALETILDTEITKNENKLIIN